MKKKMEKEDEVEEEEKKDEEEEDEEKDEEKDDEEEDEVKEEEEEKEEEKDEEEEVEDEEKEEDEEKDEEVLSSEHPSLPALPLPSIPSCPSCPSRPSRGFWKRLRGGNRPRAELGLLWGLFWMRGSYRHGSVRQESSKTPPNPIFDGSFGIGALEKPVLGSRRNRPSRHPGREGGAGTVLHSRMVFKII